MFILAGIRNGSLMATTLKVFTTRDRMIEYLHMKHEADKQSVNGIMVAAYDTYKGWMNWHRYSMGAWEVDADYPFSQPVRIPWSELED